MRRGAIRPVHAAAHGGRHREGLNTWKPATRSTPAPVPSTLWRCGGLQCPPGTCDHDNDLLRHAAGLRQPVAPPIVHEVLRSHGSSLPDGVRHDMEGRFGHDFGDVRIHTDARADESTRAVAAQAYTVGRQIVFRAGQFTPYSTAGRRLLVHEIMHVIQQGSGGRPTPAVLRVSDTGDSAEIEADAFAQMLAADRSSHPLPTEREPGVQILQRARCALVSAATCAAPITGSAGQFSVSEGASEAGPRARRAAMSPARQVASGHTGRARQLELILAAEAPGLLANVRGIFIDRDMSSGTAAMVTLCSAMTPPVLASPGAKCVFVPPALNREALRYREGSPTVGGLPRKEWRAQTMQTLIHEIEHVLFEGAGLGQPPGVSTASCSRASVEFELSELAAIMSEFPTRFRAVPPGASATHPARARLADWFRSVITDPTESIRGVLTTMRCACGCTEVNAFVRQTFGFVSSSWTAAERNAFNAELRRPAWALYWPL